MSIPGFARAAACATLLCSTVAADAAVKQVAGDAFEIVHTFAIKAEPAKAWQALIHPERYWPDAHTWSGRAGNLSLEAKAGGCFCERWASGESEHARVVMAVTNELLRLNGGLGPMQSMAVAGVLSIALEKSDAGTTATVTYRVNGDSLHALDQLAPVVDTVLSEQFGRWAKLASGEPLDAPPKTP